MPANQNLLPGVPFIESPLFPATVSDSALTDEERDIAVRLHTYGFAVLDFPDPDLDARIERIKAQLAPRFGIDPADATTVASCVNRRIQDAWKFDADVRAIAANQHVLDLLTRLYGRQAFPFQTLNFPIGTEQAAHTDTVHFSSLPERFMCGVWVAMEDVGPSNGPLFYVPGSHRWPILGNAMIGRRGHETRLNSAQEPFQEVWSAMVSAAGANEEVFLARKGQALIWCANLLHGGSPLADPMLTRWSQVTHYYFDDCIYYTPAYSDEAVGRLDLRDIVSISDASHKPNRYQGETIQRPPDPQAPSSANGLRRFVRRTAKALRALRR
jgi:hypothetical protein